MGRIPANLQMGGACGLSGGGKAQIRSDRVAADLNGRLQLRTPLENAKEPYAFRIHLLYLQHSGFRTGSVQPDSDNHLLGLNTWASEVEEEPEFRPCPAPLTGGTTLPMRLGLVDSSFRQATASNGRESEVMTGGSS